MSPPFHEGERAVQARAGVRGEADRLARIVTGELTDRARAYLATTQLAVLTTLDESGQPWASLLTGPQGFPEVIDGRTVALEPEHPLDPILASNLRAGPEAGMLGMDVSGRRRRLRVNGEARLDPGGRRVTLRAREVFANCPKYVQARESLPQNEGPSSPLRRPASGEEVDSWVRDADTFFIASHSATGGADASHRGGMPGFVRPSQGGGPAGAWWTLSWDDYPGNDLFQTLGNVRLDPRVGLLFVDFGGGSVLQVAGEAGLRWGGPSAAGSGTGRSVLVRVREALLTEDATPRRWRLSGYSPHNPEPWVER